MLRLTANRPFTACALHADVAHGPQLLASKGVRSRPGGDLVLFQTFQKLDPPPARQAGKIPGLGHELAEAFAVLLSVASLPRGHEVAMGHQRAIWRILVEIRWGPIHLSEDVAISWCEEIICQPHRCVIRPGGARLCRRHFLAWLVHQILLGSTECVELPHSCGATQTGSGRASSITLPIQILHGLGGLESAFILTMLSD